MRRYWYSILLTGSIMILAVGKLPPDVLGVRKAMAKAEVRKQKRGQRGRRRWKRGQRARRRWKRQKQTRLRRQLRKQHPKPRKFRQLYLPEPTKLFPIRSLSETRGP